MIWNPLPVVFTCPVVVYNITVGIFHYRGMGGLESGGGDAIWESKGDKSTACGEEWTGGLVAFALKLRRSMSSPVQNLGLAWTACLIRTA